MRLQVFLQLEWKWKTFATLLADMLGYIFGFIHVKTGHVVLQMILLNKLFITVLTFEPSLSFMSQIMFFQISTLSKPFLTNFALKGFFIVVNPHVKFQMMST